MKRLLIFLFILSTLALCGGAWGAVIYVDKTLSSDITDGSYSIANKDDSGADGDAHKTVQGAITAVAAGDTILMRGGTYAEHIVIPDQRVGTSDAWIVMKSFPGEWAIINPGHDQSDSVITYNSGSKALRYWRFEHFEVTGGGVDSDSAEGNGFLIYPGHHLVFKYLYVHDNYGNGDNNNSGLNLHSGGTSDGENAANNCEIAYCYFADNGGAANSNQTNLVIYSDYEYDPDDVGALETTRYSNTVHHNYMTGSYVSIKEKNLQFLCLNHTGSDTTWEDYGSKIHHNIIIGSKEPIWVATDFMQIYNNIFGPGVLDEITVSVGSGSFREPFFPCVYNNLFIGSHVSYVHGVDSTATYSPPIIGTAYWYNNIFADSVAEVDSRNDFNLFFSWTDWDVEDITIANIHFDQNLFHSRTSTDEIVNIGAPSSDYSLDDLVSEGYFGTNYVTQGDFQTVDAYKPDMTFAIGALTIETTGYGGAHPYLSGITIPANLGPANGVSYEWIADVEELASVSELMEDVMEFLWSFGVVVDVPSTLTWAMGQVMPAFTATASSSGFFLIMMHYLQ